jgi:exosortase
MTTATGEVLPEVRAERVALTRAQWVLAALAALELLVLYVPTVRWLFERWTMDVWHNAHGMLIPPVAAYFAWQELHDRPRPSTGSSALGFVFLAPALLLQALDAGMHTQLLSALSLVIAVPGLCLLTLGVERTKAIAIPLAFLLFALPIPLSFVERLIWQLRLLTVFGVSHLVPLMGVPVFVEGTLVHTAKGALQVADACSGFSTLYAAVAVAFLVAYSAPSTGRRVLVLLAAAPAAIAANIVRVVFLVTLVAWRGDAVLETFIHPLSGMMTFALALPLLFWLGTARRVAQS